MEFAARDDTASLTSGERRALTAHIETGFAQADRGELIDGAQARSEIQEMKDDWRRERASKPRVITLSGDEH